MTSTSKVILFTATFPYGVAEVFLETEINYLCQHYKEVIIVPYSGSVNIRPVPKNCIVMLPIIKSKSEMYLRGLFCQKAFGLFAKDFFSKKVYLNHIKLRTWIIAYAITNNYLSSQSVINLIKSISNNDILYSYWGKGGGYIFPYIKSNPIKISRFHGEWDLWEESSGNYAPIRTEVAKSLNGAFFISSKGEEYFKQKYPFCKTYVSRLGTEDLGVAKRSSDGILRVVSCSSVYPLKRVPLILEVLQNASNLTIEWTHIGAGSHFDKLEELVKNNKKEHLSIMLLGNLPNKDVLEYYKNNVVDLFINASTNEGIPVSIMEAISFDIPVIATNVGGNSEIVVPHTGILVSENPTIQELVKAIYKLRESNISSRLFWKNNYSAKYNYTHFVKIISKL